jgi:thiamine-monophosphate kinase
MTVREIGEYPLVHRLCQRLEHAFGIDPRVIVGAGDDAAVVEANGVPMVLTVDTQLEDIHFRRRWMPPFDLGWKAIAVSLSDIAAMGARPLAALLALGLQGDEPLEFVDAFYEGAISLCQATGTLLLGGDTTRSLNGIMVCSVALGVLSGQAWRRKGAQIGDVLLLTGTVGDAAAGLWLLEHEEATKDLQLPSEAVQHCLQRFRRPMPRTAVPDLLANADIHAAIDISDGLVIDTERMAINSGVTAKLYLNQLPLSASLRSIAAQVGHDPSQWALTGGEDYELLLAVPQPEAARVCDILRQANIPAQVIGEVVAKEPYPVLGALPDGTHQPLFGGFQHFAP